MPSPSTSLATLRPDLAGSLMEFDLAMDQQGFISQKIFPVFEADKASGKFGKIKLASLLQNRETKRSSGSGYSRGNYEFEDASFATEEHGAEEPVDDRESKLYREYFDAEMVATARAYRAVLENQEKRIAAAVFNTTTYTGATKFLAVTHEWDDATNATPIDNVEYAIQKIYDNTGLWANTLAINYKTFRNLRNCDQIIERINSSGAGNPSKPSDVTVAMLAAVFDLQNILVAGGTKNTANEGQTAVPGQIWNGEYAWVGRVCTTNDIKEPGVGRIIHWAEDGSTVGGTVETYRDETVRSNIVRVRHDVDELMLYDACGFLLGNIYTA